MSAKTILFLEKFDILNKISVELLNKINYFYIFDDFKKRKKNVIIITDEDEVYAFGGNNHGVLGFGHKRKVNELLINEYLSHKQIIDIKNSRHHVIARTCDGKVYTWGSNYEGLLGNGKNNNKPNKPGINKYLREEHVINISCGYSHSLALTKKGNLFAWGHNNYGQIGNSKFSINLKPERLDIFEDKLIMISCGGWHSMALTEKGLVYSWGRNNEGQLADGSRKNSTIPKLVKEKIKKISCGSEHSLLLSNEGEIYVFGNDGSQRQYKLENSIINTNCFIDIESHFYHKISIALSKNGIYYIWGIINGKIFKRLKETELSSFFDIFHFYYNITHKTIRERIPYNDYKIFDLNHTGKIENEKIESRDEKKITDDKIDIKKTSSSKPQARLIYTGKIEHEQIKSRDEKKFVDDKSDIKKTSSSPHEDHSLPNYVNSLTLVEGTSGSKLVNLKSESIYIDSASFRQDHSSSSRGYLN